MKCAPIHLGGRNRSTPARGHSPKGGIRRLPPTPTPHVSHHRPPQPPSRVPPRVQSAPSPGVAVPGCQDRGVTPLAPAAPSHRCPPSRGRESGPRRRLGRGGPPCALRGSPDGEGGGGQATFGARAWRRAALEVTRRGRGSGPGAAAAQPPPQKPLSRHSSRRRRLSAAAAASSQPPQPPLSRRSRHSSTRSRLSRHRSRSSSRRSATAAAAVAAAAAAAAGAAAAAAVTADPVVAASAASQPPQQPQ